MQQPPDWIFYLFFFAGFLGIVVSVILYFANRNESLAPRLLAIFLFLFSIITLHNGLSFTNLLIDFPHLWKVTVFATYAGPVVAYLFVRSVCLQSFRLRKADWLLFLPAFVFTLTFLPYYLLPARQKLVFITNFLADKRLMGLEPESILPEGWGVSTRLILAFSLLIAQYYLLSKKYKILQSDTGNLKHNLITYKWLFLFTTILGFFYFSIAIFHIGLLGFSVDLSALVFISYLFTIGFICFYLLGAPSILYGFQGWMPVAENATASVSSEVEFITEEKKASFTPEQGKRIKQLLENYMSTNTPFRKPGFKIRDLSVEIGIPTYQLSAFINQEYGQNFNEFINDYRIDFIISALKDASNKNLYTLEALAEDAGFNSRSSFYYSVKKKVGIKPSEYFGLKMTDESDE